MPKYSVLIPMTGYIEVVVTAENETAAEEAAWENADFSVVSNNSACEPGEFELHNYVTRGNACSAVLNDLKVNVID